MRGIKRKLTHAEKLIFMQWLEHWNELEVQPLDGPDRTIEVDE